MFASKYHWSRRDILYFTPWEEIKLYGIKIARREWQDSKFRMMVAGADVSAIQEPVFGDEEFYNDASTSGSDSGAAVSAFRKAEAKRQKMHQQALGK